MSTRRIKDAKDVSTGEKIYFTGHAKATYMSDGMNVEDAINGKQEAISDLEDIRSGAQKGATALQSVPNEYITENELTAKGYATTAEVANKVDKVNGKQLSTEDFTSTLKNKLDGLSNYDDSTVTAAIVKLRGDLDALVSGDTTNAIKTFNEIIAFLEGVEDTQSLSSIIAGIEGQIAGKQATISDLEAIRSGAALGATALQEEQYKGTYSKPSGGIPKNDLASAVQTSLGKADTALQSYTETDPTVPSWAKAASKPTYTASEVGAVPTTRKVNGKALSADITLVASDVSALPNTTVIPSKVSQLTNDSNFTSNTGTITGIKMNGVSKGNSGEVDLGTVITAHQDISGKADKVAISNQTASSLAISPNIFYIWGTMSSLSITLSSPSNSSEYNEYIFQFTSGSTATMLSVPSTVTWASEPMIEPNKTYQVSIVNNLAIIVGF